jgi:two-component system sensor histidine kinase KdpD
MRTALEKEEMTRYQNRIAIQAQREQLRANLLRAISHDLRTPLTSISGNAGILMDSADRLGDEKKRRSMPTFRGRHLADRSGGEPALGDAH